MLCALRFAPSAGGLEFFPKNVGINREVEPMKRSINGIDLYYEECGTGPAMVFIHGLGENADSWKYQVACFKAGFRTVTMDLRGHHRSGDGDEFITMELFAADIIALMDLLSIDRAHFVGLSMGGLICQELTINQQHRMKTMTLSDAAGFYPESMSGAGLEERLERIRTLPMEEVGRLVGQAATRPGIDKEILEEIIGMFQLNRKIPYLQASRSTLTADYRKHHPAMDIPTLIMVGALDLVTPIEFSRFLNRAIQNSRMTIIPNAGHMSKIENHRDYNKRLAEFLAPFEPGACRALPVRQ
ncbi:MAG: alpha/beta hydrolase [Desulfobacteraceae bacterium]|nr:alpha/beta hydrolase [Desulfobacteraceae bacterium]